MDWEAAGSGEAADLEAVDLEAAGSGEEVEVMVMAEGVGQVAGR